MGILMVVVIIVIDNDVVDLSAVAYDTFIISTAHSRQASSI